MDWCLPYSTIRRDHDTFNVTMDYGLFPIKQTEETMTCQNEQWSLPYSIIRRDHDMSNVKMNYGLFPI